MLADTENRCGSFERRRRSFGGVGLIALAAALLVAAPAVAAAAPGDATVFVHSAKSGKLGGGRLVLAGVGGRVSWATNAGHSGVLSVRRLHRRLFLPGKPATGMLHIAGQRGGEELAFRLSRPRFNAARNTVAYRAKPLPKRRAAAPAGDLRRFGAASLSIIPHPALTGTSELTVDNSGGFYDCTPGTGRCWGVLLGSGLEPNSVVHVIGSGPGFTGTHATAYGGSVSVSLNLPCNVHDVFVGGTWGDGTLTGKIGPFDPPGTCPQ
jgi:hypothetical protein